MLGEAIYMTYQTGEGAPNVGSGRFEACQRRLIEEPKPAGDHQLSLELEE